jgi:ubiquinone/menaquinone biosynthesis C-methylase UbiE
VRQLEIGPGAFPVPGFEPLDIRPGFGYVQDASGVLPFDDNTFGIIYASHVIEHIPWFVTVDVLREWKRILAPGGTLEVWTVDFRKVCNLLLEAEHESGWGTWWPDRWFRFNKKKDPYRWINGRIFAYGGTTADPNWHKAMFTAKSLQGCFAEAGFQEIRLMDRKEVRAKDHGWVNLGVCGTKL